MSPCAVETSGIPRWWLRSGVVQRVVRANPAYLARRGVPSNPEDLPQARDAITFQGYSASRGWAFQRSGAPFALELPYRLAVNSAEAADGAALAGLGFVRVLSYQVARELRDGERRAVLADFAPPSVPVSLVYLRIPA